MTESALVAIEVALIIKTKVYRSLNMGVLQGGRATPGDDGKRASSVIEVVGNQKTKFSLGGLRGGSGSDTWS